MKNHKKKWNEVPYLGQNDDLIWQRTDIVAVGEDQRDVAMVTSLRCMSTDQWQISVAYMDVAQASKPYPKSRHISWTAGAPSARDALATYNIKRRGVPPEIIEAVRAMGPPTLKMTKTIAVDASASNYPPSDQ